MPPLKKRFRVALSFPGECREFVASVATLLADSLGQDHVLYDKFHEAELTGLRTDLYLQDLYRGQSELIVVFVSADYENKPWCGLEWDAIRDIANDRSLTNKPGQMFIRFDETLLPGTFATTTGYVYVEGRAPKEIADLIMGRLNTISSLRSTLDLQSIKPFNGEVERTALFQAFKDFAVSRDIVFAIGGVGSGLRTFIHQFATFLEQNEDHTFPSADFDDDIYQTIRDARIKQREATVNYRRINDHDQFDLKCLLTTMAYMTYNSLREQFGKLIDDVVPGTYTEPAHFADFYFIDNVNDSMFKAATGPIVEHFFRTVQNLAEASGTDHVIVFMPWSKLAACFENHSDCIKEKLATDLWDALGEFAANNQARVKLAINGETEVDRFDRVSLIVAGSEVPFGHTVFRQALVRKSVWPIPPLDVGEVSVLLGMISQELTDQTLAEILIEWTGGAPWYLKLVLSCVEYLSGISGSASTDLDGQAVIEAACSIAEEILAHGPESVQGDLKRDFMAHDSRVRDVLGAGEATDTVIEEAWAGSRSKRIRGISASPRVEDFFAAGLTWMDGELWDRKSPQSIFRRYHTIYFRRAGRLPLQQYRVVTQRQLELAEN